MSRKPSLDGDWAAFPRPAVLQQCDAEYHQEQEGMSLRQYAAIKLKVPNSGTDWLDEMIRQSLRDEFAAKAMQSIAIEGQKPD
jgi:hypothetical protein